MQTFPATPAILAALALAGAATAAEPPSPPASGAPAALDLRALFAERDGKVVLAPTVSALRGRSVRVRGFMVHQEDPPVGAFYLAAHPVDQDESGAGTADLPPASLLVRVPALSGAELPWRPGLLEVVGTLEVGREEEPDGRVSPLRVILADPAAG